MSIWKSSLGILDVFSRRIARAEREGRPDVYQYSELPDQFRVQVVHTWERSMPSGYNTVFSRLDAWGALEKAIAEAHGRFQLGKSDYHAINVANYFLKQETLQALDVIEVVFGFIDSHLRKDFEIRHCRNPDRGIAELNERFREYAIGYQFANGQLVRIDSQYVHAEAVRPALQLLSDRAFKGVEEEFLKAHRLYRERDFKGAVAEANKAFESVMKVICNQRKLSHPKGKNTAAALVDVLVNHAGLVPKHLEQAMLAISEIRNREGAHGQGEQLREIPSYRAAYALHLTASTIVMLVEAHRANP